MTSHRVRTLTVIATLALIGAGCTTAKSDATAHQSALATPGVALAATPGSPTAAGAVPLPSAPLADTPDPSAGDTAAPGRATIRRLEREARALARTTGCARAGDCRMAPVGARACGGPRTFIPYCAASTDTVALMRKLAELEQAEKSANARAGVMGSCRMLPSPTAALDHGACRQSTAADVRAPR